jgi:hypothetical protein
MQERPIKNLAMRIAAETPIGAFPLIDYLVVTSENVGAGLQQLARYFRLVDAPYTLDLREDEDPIRVLFHSPANPFSVEFGVTLTVLGGSWVAQRPDITNCTELLDIPPIFTTSG